MRSWYIYSWRLKLYIHLGIIPGKADADDDEMQKKENAKMRSSLQRSSHSEKRTHNHLVLFVRSHIKYEKKEAGGGGIDCSGVLV